MSTAFPLQQVPPVAHPNAKLPMGHFDLVLNADDQADMDRVREWLDAEIERRMRSRTIYVTGDMQINAETYAILTGRGDDL